MKIRIHNCHAHVFTSRHIPDKFLPLGLVRFLAKNNRTQMLGRFLNYCNPFSSDDVFDRYARFMEQGDQAGQEQILEGLQRAYPSDARYVLLSLDFHYMEAGEPAVSFEEQLAELAALKRRQPDLVFPFICVDPRRQGVLDLVKEYIEEKGFAGLKLYPPLGFFPFDDRLDPVYEYAQANELPVLTHCNRGGIYYRGAIKKADHVHPVTGKWLPGWSNKSFTDHYSAPENFAYVLKKFPELKLCFGHFGGAVEWKKYMDDPDPAVFENSWYYLIRELIQQYPNVYADISYALADFSLLGLLKITLESPEVRNRVLFGSDFYMSELESTEFRWSIDLRAALGEEKYRLIAETNPRQFLSLQD